MIPSKEKEWPLYHYTCRSKSRFPICMMDENKTLAHMSEIMVKRLKRKHLFSITLDCGKEFANHSETSVALNNM